MKTSDLIKITVGIGLGYAWAWISLKSKYEKIAQNEIDSVKAAFSEMVNKSPDNSSIEEVADFMRKKARINYSDICKSETDINEQEATMPHIVTPEEFGELDDYERISLTLFNDRVLVDDNDDVIENIDEIVGLDSLNHFGEYEEDSVFVRNDRLKCDYEILIDKRNYSDVSSKYNNTGD